MKPPPDFHHVTAKEKVYPFKKALYGLKQSPQALFERFNNAMKNIHRVKLITPFFFKLQKSGVTTLILYVDGIIEIGMDQNIGIGQG